MYEKKNWVNRQSEHPARRKLTPTGNENEYDVARAEGLVMEDGDAFDAATMNDMERRIAAGFSALDPGNAGADACVQEYTCEKSGSVYALTGRGAVGRCKIPAAWADGDTWTVNGAAVPAYCGADAVDGDTIVAGRWVLFFFDGSQLNFSGGGGLSSGKLAQATATAAQVLADETFYAGSKTLQKGAMPNNGAVAATLTPGGSYTVPEGYHDGKGVVKAQGYTSETKTVRSSNIDQTTMTAYFSGTVVGITSLTHNDDGITSMSISGSTVVIHRSGTSQYFSATITARLM